ncbi:hypothetical protein AURDEDRAFT_181906 [Auricularia subglabra TFB-10046 SS5]|nr:hypothetical protein AURDEDRAFT_181906 [Auricularia subglabra TFB-10046 SS5]
MPLFDDVDRFARSAQRLRETTAGAVKRDSQALGGPFATAVLDVPLAELFRNADAAECALFVRSGAPSDGAFARKAVATATPLRPRRKEQQKETPAEVYLEAALKYIDRYQSLKDLSEPRAAVVQQLQHIRDTRKRISDMQAQLEALEAGEGVPAKTSAKDEEKKLRQLQTRAAQMARRRDALREQLARATRATIANAPVPHAVDLPESRPSSRLDDDDDDADESVMWAPKTDGSASSLLDEELDIGGDSIMLDGSPLKPKSKPSPAAPAPAPFASLTSIFKRSLRHPEHEPSPPSKLPPADFDESFGEDDEADTTITLAAPPAPTPITPATPPRPPSPEQIAPPSTARRRASASLKITPELERIVSKIWTTLRDVLLPKSATDTSPPSPRETLVLLESLAVPSSPSTLQQSLTARLLLALLRSETHAVPLAQLKTELAAAVVASGAESEEGANVKAVYACVAKKCVRIDRATREQLVKFDV